jgi:hypothetical protein
MARGGWARWCRVTNPYGTLELLAFFNRVRTRMARHRVCTLVALIADGMGCDRSELL